MSAGVTCCLVGKLIVILIPIILILIPIIVIRFPNPSQQRTLDNLARATLVRDRCLLGPMPVSVLTKKVYKIY